MKIQKTEYLLSTSSDVRPKKKRRYQVVADSFTGLVRHRNEDSFVYAWDADCRYLMAAVADGIGSTVNGDIASNYLLQMLVQAWREFKAPKRDDARYVGDFLYKTVCDINLRLYRINAIGANGPDRDSLGTTISAAVFMKNTMVAVNAGDSPIFRIRGDQLDQLTFDHNLANEMVRMKEIKPEEAETLERGRMLTRFIGPRPDVDPECYRFDVRTGDCFILCSDGLPLHLPLDEIGRVICSSNGDLNKVMKILLGRTFQRGAMDNVTMVMVKAL